MYAYVIEDKRRSVYHGGTYIPMQAQKARWILESQRRIGVVQEAVTYVETTYFWCLTQVYPDAKDSTTAELCGGSWLSLSEERKSLLPKIDESRSTSTIIM